MLLIGALAGGFWFGLFVLSHVISLLLWPRQHRSRLLLKLIVAALLSALVTALLVPSEMLPGLAPAGHRVVAVVAALATVSCSFILYTPMYYVVVSSLTGQMLVKLNETEDGSLPLDALASPVTYRRIVEPRLDSMVASGLLSRQDGVYRATLKGIKTARTFRYLKALWQLGPGG
ncbi:MAG: hypothetical protein AB7K36_22535 [Chloroflexota bacterium]